MEENLIKTCLHDRHVKQGALMSPFGGFDMPIQYTTIIEEHNAVRNNVGVFDVSHMGEVRVKGKDAYKYVSHIFVNDVTGAPDGQIFYGMMCYENGGTVDDLLVYKVNDEEYFLVINAANIDKDVAWIEKMQLVSMLRSKMKATIMEKSQCRVRKPKRCLCVSLNCH